MIIGDRIKELRIEKGITQSELANKLGYKTNVPISKWENGIDGKIKSTQIQTLANIFDVTPSYLMGWTDRDGNDLTVNNETVLAILSTHTKLLNEIGKSKKLLNQIDKLAELKDEYRKDVYNVINDLYKK